LRELDAAVRASRRTREPSTPSPDETEAELEDDDDDAASEWRVELLERLHQLTPDGFEEFVLYLLRSYGLELSRVGGTGDEGIDGIGTAPLSPVLSATVAVQAKRYEPSRTVGRETVALFQRDAAAAGAERAVMVTLGRFSEPARKAATTTTPTVDLIDGQRIADLVREQEMGVKVTLTVIESWFDRFDD
jgi:restriction system protein